jgi:hypothetical protein
MSSRVFTVFSRWKEIAFSITLRWCGADISSFKRENDENDVDVGDGVLVMVMMTHSHWRTGTSGMKAIPSTDVECCSCTVAIPPRSE